MRGIIVSSGGAEVMVSSYHIIQIKTKLQQLHNYKNVI